MAQNNRLKYYISFEADTKKAKAQIDDMMNSLKKVNSTSNVKTELFNKEDLRQARTNVAELENMLKNALNVDTGRLDLSKLNRSLSGSNKTLEQFRKSFSALGEEGRDAFSKITQAVLSGEAPLKRQNALIDKMAETMRNTIRWQVSTTAFNAFTSAITNAYQYAEDLNRSLNDIRIVTGQSVEQMDAFAEKANKAAKELRTTTKAYTDAALIFYQQGLEDSEVVERTNAVMKMSNVTGEVASDVSSYMTAIWNNFDDGTHSLEYFADSITALGATTAASSAEIAGGLEKFAAVADTVGLSYEYATAALATVIDKTRQGEEIVGTAFKTIFARLSSLSLGETLEDGTNLTKYSQALADVGISIKNQNGELKDMDTILDEMGAKWQGLNNAQKNALAQTVGGVRQYNQLIALMDNFDSFQANIDIAINSEGTLTEQADIFAESWLGAQKRVTAALESIYNTLLEDDIFIFLTNGFASILEGIDWILDRAGGLPAAISLAGLAIKQIFGKDIKQTIDDIFYSFKTHTGQTQKEIAALMETVAVQNGYLQTEYDMGQLQSDLYIEQAKWTSQILKTHQAITDELLTQYKAEQTVNDAYKNAALELERGIAKRERRQETLVRNIPKSKEFKVETADLKSWSFANELSGLSNAEFKNNLISAIDNLDEGEIKERLNKKINSIGNLNNLLNKKALSNLATELDTLTNQEGYLDNFEIKASYLANRYAKGKKAKTATKEFLYNEQAIKRESESLKDAKKQLELAKQRGLLAAEEGNEEEFNKQFELYEKRSADVKKYADNIEDLTNKNKNLIISAQGINTEIKEEKIQRELLNKQSLEQKKNLEAMFSSATAGAFKMISGLSAVNSAIKSLKDESLTVEQKLTQVSTSMLIGLPQMRSGWKDLTKAYKKFSDIDFQKLTKNNAILSKMTGGATSLKAALMALSPYLLMVAAGVAAVYIAWKEYEKTTPEYKLKKAEEAAEKAASSVKKLSQEYKELKNTIEGYNSAYNAIEEMVVGTLEWREAVNELNAQMDELIEKYALIQGEDFNYDSQGFKYLTKTGEEKIYADMEKRSIMASTTQAQTTMGIANAKQAVADKELNKAFKKIGLYDSEKEELYEKYIKTGLIPSLEELDKHLLELEIPLSLNEQGLKDLREAMIKASKTTGSTQAANSQAYGSTAAMWIAENGLGVDIDSSLKSDYIDLASEEIANIINNYTNKFNEATDYKQLLSGVTTENGEVISYDTKTVDYGQNPRTVETFFITSADGKKTEITAEEAARYYSSYQFAQNEDIHQNSFEAGHKARLIKAQDQQYGHMYDKETIDNWDNDYRSSITSSNMAKSNLDEKQVDEYQKYLKENLDITDETAKNMAVANIRFNEGMSDLLDNWEEYKNILIPTNKGTAEYVETLETLKQKMSEILNVDTSVLSEEFLTNAENMRLMEQAYLGNVEAIGELQKNMASSMLDGIESIDDIAMAEFNSVIRAMELNSQDLKIGMTLDDTAATAVYGQFVDLMNQLLQAGTVTAEQVTDVLNGINLSPEIEYEEIPGRTEREARTSGYVYLDGKYQRVNSSTKLTTDTKVYFPKINSSKTTVTGTPGGKLSTENRNKGASNAANRKSSMKKPEDEIERYHVIKEVIEDVNKELDILNKAKSRAWGGAHLALIDQEIEKTKEAISAQEEYLRQIEENRKQDKARIMSYGAQLDEMGRIVNYEELMRQQINRYNAAVASGNEAQIKAAEEQYENFKKALSQYEETADLFEDEYQKLIDIQNRYFDKLLEKVKYKVEIDIQLSEEADRFFNYLLNRLEDKAYSAAEAIAVLGDQTQESLNRIEAYQEGLNNIFKNHGFGEDALQDFLNGKITADELANSGFTTEEIETIIQYRNGLLEENENLLKLRDTVMNKIMDTFEEYTDSIDNLIDKFEHLSNVTKSYQNIVDIVGKKALGISNDLIRTMNKVSVENATNVVRAAKDKLEATESALEDLTKAYNEYIEKSKDESLTEEERKYWAEQAEITKKQMGEVEKASQDAKEEFLGSWEEALTLSREVFEQEIELIVEEFEDALAGIYGSIEAMKEAYDQNKQLRDLYAAEYERIYELNKLNRDITNSLDTTDSIVAKQELRKLQEEINELQESGVELSKYDLDMLRMKYELRLAEIALEDAQNAKSQVRMSRDNDGNWSYVYTADESAVTDAARNYESKMLEMQQRSNNYIDEMSEKWLRTQIEMEQAYVKIMQDRTLSDEERLAAIDRLYAYYGEQFNFMDEQIGNALENNQELYQNDWMSWAEKNNIQIKSNEDFMFSFNQTILGITTGVESIETLHDNLNKAMGAPGEGGFLGDLDAAYRAWQAEVDSIMIAAGTSVGEFGSQFGKVAKDTQEASDKTAEEVEDMADRMKVGFGDAVTAANNWANQYAGAISQAILRNEKMGRSLTALLQAVSAVTGAYIDLNSVAGIGSADELQGLINRMREAEQAVNPNQGSGGATKYRAGFLVRSGYSEEKATFDSYEAAYNAMKNYWITQTDAADYYRQQGVSEKDLGNYFDASLKNLPEFKIDEIKMFDTGGYTGAWGQDGRLALLHEKELVLNKNDTANFLNAVEVVRDIVKSVDLNASMAGMGIGALSSRWHDSSTAQMEQNITIYADFPNATNHNEIEEAFKNMVNLASQYSNRKA